MRRKKKELLKAIKRTKKKEPTERWEEKQKNVPDAMGGDSFIDKMLLGFSFISRC